jgi:MYXO-CTERM domain-containing protein
MNRLALVALVLLALPATAAAKGAHSDVRLVWLSEPGGTRAGETWRATFEFRDPNGNRLIMDNVHPLVRASSEGGADVLAGASQGVTPGRYVADLRFRTAGSYQVSLTRFDPRDPERFIEMDAPVVVGRAAVVVSDDDADARWALLGILVLPLAALLRRRRRAHLAGPAAARTIGR